MDDGAQADSDRDGYGHACDPCPMDGNNACTTPNADDLDEDGIPNGVDNCVDDANRDQADADRDGHGDACDDCASANPGFERCPLPLNVVRDPSHPDNPPFGSTVSVRGLYVTAVRRSIRFYAQTTTSEPFNGVFIATAEPVTVGQLLDVTGVYEDRYGQGQIGAQRLSFVGSPGALPFDPIAIPDPATVATGGALAESYEGMVIRVGPVTVTDPANRFDEFLVTGGLMVDDDLFNYSGSTYPVGTRFESLAGVLGFGLATTSSSLAARMTSCNGGRAQPTVNHTEIRATTLGSSWVWGPWAVRTT